MIEQIYTQLCKRPSDINEHLPTLSAYASECETVLELGVRGVVSSWAFAHGLLNNGSTTKRLFCNDLVACDISKLETECAKENIDVQHAWISDLDLPTEPNSFDLVFIDTFHVYGQLKRELEKFGKVAKKYILMHDTTVDAIRGELLRLNMNADQMTKMTGIPKDELTRGLQPAIDEFLVKYPEWKLHKDLTNNNGLTILKRV